MTIRQQQVNAQLPLWAAIDQSRGSISDYLNRCRDQVVVPVKQFALGKRAVVIGAGVAGLASAFELLKNEIGCSCTVLEANDRVGGRSFTVRPGDVIKEDKFDPQVCTFENEPNQSYPPYLNAGPGRIPSSHKLILRYMRELKVPMEVYVMASDSNRTYIKNHFENLSVPNRKLAYSMQGWLAQELYHLLRSHNIPSLTPADIAKFKQFLQIFGDLDNQGQYQGRDRIGYNVLPEVNPGEPTDPIPLKELLESEFWKTSFYQPIDWLWQPTSLQPVGGMDKIVHAFRDKVKALGGDIQLNAVVDAIQYDSASGKYLISYTQQGEHQTIEADYCFSNIPIPFLEKILQSDHFSDNFQTALQAVYKAQNEGQKEENGYTRRFLADTTKVGWQAKRNLWQTADGPGDVPMYGGISWTTDEIVQIWYPSHDYHAELGVLTGAYNYSKTACEWGQMPPKDRLDCARTAARNLGGDSFADGLNHGLAIAWQNVPHLKGGWAQWNTVKKEDRECSFNTLVKGDQNFYIVGDQLSNLTGWQEGAIASALNAVSEFADSDYKVPDIDILPDTRLTVEGAFWALL